MALALVAPADVVVGEPIAFSVSGATHSGSLKVAVASEADGSLGFTATVAADSSGNYASTGNLDVVPGSDLPVTITVTDVTAAATVSDRVKVFESA